LSKSAFHLAEELLHEDPKNQLGLLYRHHAEFVFGRAEVLSGAIADGFEHIEHALQSEEEILESDRGFAYANGFLTTHSVMAGSTALGAGRGADAKRHFERAVVLATEQSTAHPSDAQALFNLSQAEFGLAEADPTSATEHRAKAREAARRILQVHPDNPWAQKLARK
jgi:tetratricopeptide (TPR) repeat protein